MITMLVTFLLIMIPIAVINASIAKRKGKSRALFGWLSIIPLFGYFLAFYLISFPDKEINDKLDRILVQLGITSDGAAKNAE
jgi:uncharacterized membrane protein